MSYGGKEDFVPESMEFSRREVLTGLGTGAKYTVGGHGGDSILNFLGLAKIGEVGSNGVKDEYMSHSAIEELKNGGNISADIYVLGDDTVMGEGLETAERRLEPHFNSLSEGDVELEMYSVDTSEELDEMIYETRIKPLRGKEVNQIRDYLQQQDLSPDDSDLSFYIGDFKTSPLDYKGSCVDEGEAAACNSISPEYVYNQVLHNFGHLMGLGHTTFAPYYDPMSWGVGKQLRMRYEIIPFAQSRRYLEDVETDV